jgi:hypothetical protein
MKGYLFKNNVLTTVEILGKRVIKYGYNEHIEYLVEYLVKDDNGKVFIDPLIFLAENEI